MSKRIKWLDFAKGFTMLFVVLAHCANPQLHPGNILIKFIVDISFIFVMPVFFSISGYLYKSIKNTHEFLLLLYKKSISLLIPYFIFSFIYSLCNIMMHNKVSIIDFILGFKQDMVLWFLLSLFLVFITTGVLDLLKIKHNLLLIISFIILLISKNFWVGIFSSHLNYSSIYMIYSYFMFFYLGLFIKGHKMLFRHIFIEKKWQISYIILFILSCIVSLKLDNQTNFITLTTIITKILSVLVGFSIFINLNENSYFFKYFDKYGKYTLIIYLIHFSFESQLVKYLPSTFLMFVLLFIASWAVSILVCYLSAKVSFIDFIFYPRKYINKLFY